MAKNRLTPEQDLIAREFYEEVALVSDDFLSNAPATGRQLRAIVLEILGYEQLPTGARVAKDMTIKGAFGSNIYEGYADEWYEDAEDARAKIKARASVESEGT